MYHFIPKYMFFALQVKNLLPGWAGEMQQVSRV